MPAFNPLLSDAGENDVFLLLQRRVLKNILDSYHGTYDVFAEVTQNAVDAIDKRRTWNDDFSPKIDVTVDIPNRQFTIIDNGIGISDENWRKILAPHESFQEAEIESRGHKGVGFSYLAYGFAQLEVATKSPDGEIKAGRIVGGRRWVSRQSEDCPMFEPYSEEHPVFNDLDFGTLVRISLDATTKPRGLNLLGGQRNNSYELTRWKTIMLTKTAAGRIFPEMRSTDELRMDLTVFAPNRQPQNERDIDCSFQLPCPIDSQYDSSYLDLTRLESDARIGDPGAMYSNKTGMYCYWDTERLTNEMRRSLDEDSLNLIAEKSMWVYAFMAWESTFFSDYMNHRGDKGLICASQKMVLIPNLELNLNRYSGAKEYSLVMVHMNDAIPDLGRKSLPSELQALSNDIGRKMISYFHTDNKRMTFLRPADGRGQFDGDLYDWRVATMNYHDENQLRWRDEVFPLASIPQQEQEVVTLFGQMVSQDILPGWRIYAAAEGNRKYDSIMKYRTDEVASQMTFSQESPQGLTEGAIRATQRESRPLCVEFKYDLSSILPEFNSEAETSKQFGEIDVLIAWKCDGFNEGSNGNYMLESCSFDASAHTRMFIGQTHVLRCAGEAQPIPVILLKDLFKLANDWETGQAVQRGSYFLSN